MILAAEAIKHQPPSGGCELKQEDLMKAVDFLGQPPSGGCELKHDHRVMLLARNFQPPSGGCELKPAWLQRIYPACAASRLRAAVS